MKTRLIISIIIIKFTLLTSATTPANYTDKKVKKETKLTIEQRLSLMTRELSLTTDEQTQIRNILKHTQLEKEKIKALNFTKKDEKARIEKIKNLQKLKLKSVLGSKRFSRYQKLKKEDVF